MLRNIEENNEIQEIYDEIKTEEFTDKRLIFDLEKHDKVKYTSFSLTEDRIFKKPFMNKLKMDKKEIAVISEREHAIDIRQIEGNTRIPLLRKETINEEIERTKSKNIYKYVELAATEIIIKACFKEGIDTPLELILVDERIRHPIEKSIIAKLTGNLIYQKVIFTIKPNYTISLADQNLDMSYNLHWKLSGIKMPTGSKVITVLFKNAYIISTTHNIRIKNKLSPITINEPFKELIKSNKEEKVRFLELDNSKPLQLVEQRIERKYYIKIKIENESVITEINNNKQTYLKRFQEKKLEIIRINMAGINIDIKCIAGNNKENVLGRDFLEIVKPWERLEDKFIFTYNQIKFETPRIK